MAEGGVWGRGFGIGLCEVGFGQERDWDLVIVGNGAVVEYAPYGSRVAPLHYSKFYL